MNGRRDTAHPRTPMDIDRKYQPIIKELQEEVALLKKEVAQLKAEKSS